MSLGDDDRRGLAAALAEARAGLGEAGIPIAPHYLGGAVGLVASLHLFASIPGGLLMELDPHPNPLREELGGDLLAVQGGHLRLPPGPGLGLEPSEELIQRYLGGAESSVASWLLSRREEEMLISIEPVRLFSWDYRERMSDVDSR